MNNEVKIGKFTADEFAQEVHKLTLSGVDHLDAVVTICEKNGIEIEAAGALIKSSVALKSKIKVYGEKMNYLPKTSRLPI